MNKDLGFSKTHAARSAIRAAPPLHFFVFALTLYLLFSAFDPFSASALEASVQTGQQEVRQIEAIREAALKTRLRAEKIDFTEHPLMQSTGGFGTSIYVELPLKNNSEDAPTIIFTLPVSSDYNSYYKAAGQKDTYFGFEIVIQFIKKILAQNSADAGNTNAAPEAANAGGDASNAGGGAGSFIDKNIVVCFLADEFLGLGPNEKTVMDEKAKEFDALRFAGFRELLNYAAGLKDPIIVYAEIFTMFEKLNIVQGSGKNFTPLFVIAPFIETCAKENVSFAFPSRYGLFYRTGFISETIPVTLSEDQGIEVLYLQSSGNGTQSAEKYAGVFFDYAAALKYQPEEDLIENYIPFIVKDKVIMFNEIQAVLLSFVIELLVLFISILMYIHAKKENKSGKVFLSAFIVFAALFLIMLYFDIMLLPFLMISLLFLSLLLFLYRRRHKKLSTGKIKAYEVIIIALCVVLSLFPYIDLVRNTASALAYKRSNTVADMPVPSGQELVPGVRSTMYLERNIYQLNFDTKEERLLVTLSFDAPPDKPGEPLFVYSSPAPYIINENRIDFTLGLYPPKKFKLEIDLPQDIEGSFSAEQW